MKKSILCLMISTLLFSSFSFGQDYIPEDEETPFTRGALVGDEPDDYRRSIRRERFKNWGLAAGSIAVGIATLILVGKNHRELELEKKMKANNNPESK